MRAKRKCEVYAEEMLFEFYKGVDPKDVVGVEQEGNDYGLW